MPDLSNDAARDHDHLAVANDAAFAYYELVDRAESLTGYQHLAAAALATGVADHLVAYAEDQSDPDIAAAIYQASANARDLADTHDGNGWQDRAARHDVDTMIAEVIA